MILYFLGATPLEEIEDLENLISDVTTILKRGGKITEVIHKILLLLVSDFKAHQTITYYKQLIVSMENNLSDVTIWSDENIFENYLKTLVKGVAYGINGVMVQCMKMIEFMLGKTDQVLIKKNMPKILGPVIRVGSYPIHPSQKIDVLNCVHDISEKGYSISIYSYQVTTLCFRMLQELRHNVEVPKKVATLLVDLLKSSNDKRNIVNSILNRCKASSAGPEAINESTILSVYHLFKLILSDNK